jgi:hypothetical protein
MLFEERLGGEERRLMHLVPAEEGLVIMQDPPCAARRGSKKGNED